MSRGIRIQRDKFITSLSNALEAGNIDDIKKLASKFSSADDNKKRAFFDAEEILLKSCIDHNDFDRLMTLFKTINSSDNMQLKVCSCIALSNILIKEKNVLVNDKIRSQELGKLLTQECEKLAASDQKKISERVGEALKAIQYNQEHRTGEVSSASVEQVSSSMHK